MNNHNLSKLQWIYLLVVISGLCLYFAVGVKFLVPWLAISSTFILSVAFYLTFWYGFSSGKGTFATEESGLDEGTIYQVTQVISLKNGDVLLLFFTNGEYKTEVAVIPRGCFKKFDLLEKRYLVPKKLKAKLVEGALFIPARN